MAKVVRRVVRRPAAAPAAAQAAQQAGQQQVKDQLRGMTAFFRMPAVKFYSRGGIAGVRQVSLDVQLEIAEVAGVDKDEMKTTLSVYGTKETRDPAVRVVDDAINNVKRYIAQHTIPYYPERGVRLLRRVVKDEEIDAACKERPDVPRERVTRDLMDQHLKTFMANFETLVEQLRHTVAHFNQHEFARVVEGRRAKLGPQFRRDVYGDGIRCDYLVKDVEIIPPTYASFDPELRRKAMEQLATDFAAAKNHLISELCGELSRRLKTLAEDMRGYNADGKPKVFKNVLINGIKTQLKYFQEILAENNLSSDKLDEVMQRLHTMVDGIGDPDTLRPKGTTDPQELQDAREYVARQAGEIVTAMQPLLVTRPKRNVVVLEQPFVPPRARIEVKR